MMIEHSYFVDELEEYVVRHCSLKDAWWVRHMLVGPGSIHQVCPA